METRVAVMSIIVEDANSVEPINALLHEHGPYIIGRMGIPYRERGISIISIAMDAPDNTISALAGKIGDRYLLRHETATKSHYERLHPPALSFDNRMRCLYDLRKIV